LLALYTYLYTHVPSFLTRPLSLLLFNLQPYYIKRTVNKPYDQVLQITRDQLAKHQFGVPTEMDTYAILKAKLGKETDRRVILGACLPGAAYEALAQEPEIAALLPCNVVVREMEGGESSEVMAVSPAAMFSLTSMNDPAMYKPVEEKLLAVLDDVVAAAAE
jgi:uncharacterized protein (DUF302 family)